MFKKQHKLTLYQTLENLTIIVDPQEIEDVYKRIFHRLVRSGGHTDKCKYPLYLNQWELRMLILASWSSSFFQNVLAYYCLNYTLSVLQYSYLYKFVQRFLKIWGRDDHPEAVNRILRYSQGAMPETKVYNTGKAQIFLYGFPIHRINDQHYIYLVKYLKQHQIYLGIGKGRSGVPSHTYVYKFIENNYELKPMYVYDTNLYFVANEILFFRINQFDEILTETQTHEYQVPKETKEKKQVDGKEIEVKTKTLKLTRLITTSQLWEAGMLTLYDEMNSHCPVCLGFLFGTRNIVTVSLTVNKKALVGKYHSWCLEEIKTKVFDQDSKEGGQDFKKPLSLLL